MVVDDSNLARLVMTLILGRDQSIEVCAAVSDGEAALSLIPKCKPDVITMDLNMPGLSGIEVTRRIMATNPVPIVIVTTDKTSTANPFQFLEAGAIAVLCSPAPPGHPEHDQTSEQLIRTVKALSSVKMFPRRDRGRSPALSTACTIGSSTLSSVECIAIGASTGGPQIIKKIIESLPADYPIPILVTQHIAQGFTASFVKWLNASGKITAVLASDGLKMEPGHVYVAPDDKHLGVTSLSTIALSDHGRYRMRPSISHMFHSLASVYGKRCAAILLTGMGKDGAAEMADLKKRGAFTIAQDKDSSLIHSMPGEAIACDGASEILAPDKIVERLLAIAATKAKRSPC